MQNTDPTNEEIVEKLDIDEVFLLSLRDPRHYKEIITHFQSPFMSKALSILKNEHYAADAVQETFVRMYASAAKYRKQKDASFSSWAYKILINQCFTQYKKRKRERVMTATMPEEWTDQVADPYATREFDQKLTKDYVMSLVSKLPAALRRSITLYFFEEMPQAEIARQEGVSHDVVRTRIHRAKQYLKKYIKEQS
jgi:RNA polymerase sigma-70 factor (ECF subfamily)